MSRSLLEEAEDDEWLWIAGVSISAVGSFLATAGLGLQKMTHMKRAEKHKETGVEDKSSYMKQPMWLLGMSLIVLDSILDLITFGLAPQSLLAPMAALTLVYNTLLAPIFLKEQLGKEDLTGTVLIAAGIIMIVIFAEKETPEYTITEIRHLYQSWNATFYFIVVVSFLVFLWWCTRQITHNTKETLEKMDPVRRKFYPFSYPILGGTFGGQSVLFAKAVVELVKTTFTVSNQFIYPEIYVFTVLLAASLYCQTMYLNSGLKRFDSLFVIPVYQVAWIISGIAGGGVFYQEFTSFSLLEAIMFISGCTVTFIGVRYISMRDHDWEGGDEDSNKDNLEAGLLDGEVSSDIPVIEVGDVDIDGAPTRGQRGSSVFQTDEDRKRLLAPPKQRNMPVQYSLGTTAQALDELFNVHDAFIDAEEDEIDMKYMN